MPFYLELTARPFNNPQNERKTRFEDPHAEKDPKTQGERSMEKGWKSSFKTRANNAASESNGVRNHLFNLGLKKDL